jgi:hypothetical protein
LKINILIPWEKSLTSEPIPGQTIVSICRKARRVETEPSCATCIKISGQKISAGTATNVMQVAYLTTSLLLLPQMLEEYILKSFWPLWLVDVTSVQASMPQNVKSYSVLIREHHGKYMNTPSSQVGTQYQPEKINLQIFGDS